MATVNPFDAGAFISGRRKVAASARAPAAATNAVSHLRVRHHVAKWLQLKPSRWYSPLQSLSWRAPIARRAEQSLAAGEFVLEDSDSNGSMMSTRRFNIMLRECAAALRVRQHRNRSAAHPLHSSSVADCKAMRDLYKKAVAARLPILAGFVNLAKASVSHVDEELSSRASKEMEKPRTAPPLDVVQL